MSIDEATLKSSLILCWVQAETVYTSMGKPNAALGSNRIKTETDLDWKHKHQEHLSYFL